MSIIFIKQIGISAYFFTIISHSFGITILLLNCYYGNKTQCCKFTENATEN